jgi:hypothetical protein
MSIYRVTFALNKIAAIKELDDENNYSFEEKTYHYEYNGFLIFALVRADNEEEARAEATAILEKLSAKKSGQKD